VGDKFSLLGRFLREEEVMSLARRILHIEAQKSFDNSNHGLEGYPRWLIGDSNNYYNSNKVHFSWQIDTPSPLYNRPKSMSIVANKQV
jgi:hypothetical protein